MKTINLKDFYYWYTQDEFIEVSDEVAEEMLADKRHQKSQERQMFRYKAQYTLDADNGIEAAAIIHKTDDPATILEMKEQFCSLCRALNSLPEIQGRRIEAHYILGMSQRDIAIAEGVNERNVRLSISKGLASMKKYLENGPEGYPTTPDFCQSC